ncbi:uncharacterized protein LOC130672598 isoform X2 [Microplitis mediator]|uniref:uncharacterized protein LOC130672598 isoform X2 n=1 Tax=Microplitis mediator TaxID=375433 RepID=UPI00255750B6|nr:uncharacterized protein LOC130672598 isoform X2 [Microplitis mediator]
MDENFKQEWSLLKIVAPTITFLGIIFYFIPISRSYFRKGCLIFIDAIAFSLKTILNSFETNSKFGNYSHGNIKLRDALKNNIPKEKYKKSSLKTSTKNCKGFKQVKEKNIDWPEIKLNSSRGFEFSREFIGDLKINKPIMNKKYNDTLYLENDGLASNYSQYFSPAIEDVKNLHKFKNDNFKKNKNKRKRSDVYRLTDENLADNDEEHEEEEEEEEEEREDIEESDTEMKYKLRKIRKKIMSLSVDGNKNQRQRKEFQALKLIDDLLKNNSKINDRLKNTKKTGYESLVVDGNKTYDNADGSWSGRKSTAASTRKEFSGERSSHSNRQEILHNDYYDLSDDSNDFLPPPIINDIY